jgi:DNA-binding NtrC family response regulator
MTTRLLNHKKVLIVDDEQDVLDALESTLDMCDVVKARSYEDASQLLETRPFEIAILDIMGVDGYRLLEIANRKKIIPIMLTAHAMSPEDTMRSYKEGAAYFVPKERMNEITTYLEDVLEAKEQGKSPWSRWFSRFASYYNEKFGPKWWDRHNREFWKNLGYWE